LLDLQAAEAPVAADRGDFVVCAGCPGAMLPPFHTPATAAARTRAAGGRQGDIRIYSGGLGNLGKSTVWEEHKGVRKQRRSFAAAIRVRPERRPGLTRMTPIQ
jgi:hypothetical protein